MFIKRDIVEEEKKEDKEITKKETKKHKLMS